MPRYAQKQEAAFFCFFSPTEFVNAPGRDAVWQHPTGGSMVAVAGCARDGGTEAKTFGLLLRLGYGVFNH